jgi:SAM-dependent methyltransferase
MDDKTFGDQFSRLAKDQGTADNKTFWDNLSNIYTEHYITPPKMGFINKLENELNGDDSIFEYGCSSGMNLHHLKSKGFTNVSGVDISNIAIDEGKKIYTDINILVGDYTKHVDVTTNLYDVVFSRATLQHINTNEIGNVLDKLNKVLKENKILIISECNNTIFKYGIIPNHRVYNTYNHNWGDILPKHGFTIVENIKGDDPYIKCVKNG